MTYFKKINVRNPVSFNGSVIHFEPVAGHNGVIALDDAEKIAELNRLAAARKMGVIVISKEIYESQKKTQPSPPSPNPHGGLGQVRLLPQEPRLLSPNPSQVAAPSKPNPPPVQTPAPTPAGESQPIVFKPKRGKLNVDPAARVMERTGGS